MKITRIETFDLECPLDRPFGWSQGWTTKRSTGVVRLTTDAGLVGWGEGSGGAAATIIHEQFAPLLLNADPMRRAGLWQQLYHALYNANLTGGFGGNALSAIDIALWDLAGQATELPVADLLGGRIRDHVAVYATGLYYTEDELPDRLLDEARHYVAAGFQGMKTKIGGLSLQADVQRVAALRAAIGPDIHLMVDANQTYDAATAIRIGQRLAEHDIYWFEEPVKANDLAGYLQVQAGQPLPLAGGEALRTRYEFRDFVAQHAFAHAQPDVMLVGGITEQQRVALLANTFGIQFNPHVWGSPIMIAASLHVAATIPPVAPARNALAYQQEPVMEFDRTPSAIRETLCVEPFAQVAGYLTVPDVPGLGIIVDETAVQHLTVKYQKSE